MSVMKPILTWSCAWAAPAANAMAREMPESKNVFFMVKNS